VSIEQDFEIVLDALKWSAAFPAAQERREAGKVALSRMVVEVERLRGLLEAAVEKPMRDAVEIERLRVMEEPLRTLYRFVMESRYARNIAVPSGVLDRARQALEQK
jgi:hypothetical protein